MSIWTIINIAAWVLCAVFLYLILSDLIKVEKRNREEKSLKRKTKRHTYGERKRQMKRVRDFRKFLDQCISGLLE